MFNFFIHDSEGCAMICAQEITLFAEPEPSLKWFYGENHMKMPLKKIKEIHCDDSYHNKFLIKLLKTTIMAECFEMNNDGVIVNTAYRENIE